MPEVIGRSDKTAWDCLALLAATDRLSDSRTNWVLNTPWKAREGKLRANERSFEASQSHQNPDMRKNTNRLTRVSSGSHVCYRKGGVSRLSAPTPGVDSGVAYERHVSRCDVILYVSNNKRVEFAPYVVFLLVYPGATFLEMFSPGISNRFWGRHFLYLFYRWRRKISRHSPHMTS